jgi:hypothetical protein
MEPGRFVRIENLMNRPPRLSFAAVIVLGVLVGCQSQQRPVEALSQSRLPPANGITNRLEKLPGTTGYNFEMIGDVVTPLLKKDISFSGIKAVPFIGWAVDSSSNSLASGVEVVVDGNAYQAHYGDSRPDVAQALKNPSVEKSGYSFGLPPGTLSTGPHAVEIRIITADGKKYYEVGPVSFKVE